MQKLFPGYKVLLSRSSFADVKHSDKSRYAVLLYSLL